MKKIAFLLLLSLLTTATPALSADFEVAGQKFTAPKGFITVKPASSMRKAQFRVGVDAAEGEVIFFHFGPGGAGGVEANVNRWLGKFTEDKSKINAKTSKAKLGDDTPVTFVSAEGTYKSGPPRGPVVEKKDYALLGAIIEAEKGAIFVRFTGPQATVKAHAEAFKKMITGTK